MKKMLNDNKNIIGFDLLTFSKALKQVAKVVKLETRVATYTIINTIMRYVIFTHVSKWRTDTLKSHTINCADLISKNA